MNLVRRRPIQRLDGLFHHRERGDHGPDGQIGEQLQLVDHQRVFKRGKGHVQRVFVQLHRHHQVLAAELFGQQAGQLRVGLGRGHVEQRQHQIVGVHLGNVLVLDQPRLDQHVSSGPWSLDRAFVHDGDLLGCEDLLLQQKLDQQRLRVFQFGSAGHGSLPGAAGPAVPVRSRAREGVRLLRARPCRDAVGSAMHVGVLGCGGEEATLEYVNSRVFPSHSNNTLYGSTFTIFTAALPSSTPAAHSWRHTSGR